MSNEKKIVFLASRSESSQFVFNGLKNQIDFTAVIIENPPKKTTVFIRRLKKLGWIETLGQMLFILFITRLINIISSKKKKAICCKLNLDSSPIDSEIQHSVKSVNSDRCIEILKKINPDLVLVNGTRIISKNVLDCISAEFVNTHVGITPKYRGVHGGYWALANNDKQNFGVTVHKINPGIDTGDILYQEVITPSSNDNFTTYPLIQTAVGIKLILKVIEDFESGQLNLTRPLTKESNLWYHPTLWSYLYLWMTKGIK